MKNVLFVSVLFILFAENALAGGGYDACVKEEMALKAQEGADCSGLKYLLNPSGCFATRKFLKEYASGKCKTIGIAENVDFSVQKSIPVKKDSRAASVPASTTSGVKVDKQIQPEAMQQNTTTDPLKEENARLTAEIIRLRAENEQLRKLVR